MGFDRILRSVARRLCGTPEERRERHCSESYSRMLACPDEGRFRRALAAAARYASLGGWALPENSLKALVMAIADVESPKIIEFGAGASTVFLDAYYEGSATVDSFEHQKAYAERLQTFVRWGGVRLHDAPLWRFSNDEFESIMRGEVAIESMYDLGQPLDEALYSETRIPNLFYRIDEIGSGYHAMILDGPNGSGRSIAFPVMRDRMASPSYFLVDDCNHSDFIYQCSRAFRFNIVHGEIYPRERWLLLEAIGK